MKKKLLTVENQRILCNSLQGFYLGLNLLHKCCIQAKHLNSMHKKLARMMQNPSMPSLSLQQGQESSQALYKTE